MSNEHKTAISRKTPSAPMTRLASDGRLVGRVLDYGCGKGRDADEYHTDRYDPHYSPGVPPGTFDTITCNYVLNVIECSVARLAVLRDIHDRLTPNGTAYLTVRNDRRSLRGRTITGTWQGLIVLRLPVVYRSGGYVTYELIKRDDVESSIQSARVGGGR